MMDGSGQRSGGIVLIGSSEVQRSEPKPFHTDPGADQRTQLINSVEWWRAVSEVAMALTRHLGPQTTIVISGPATLKLPLPDGQGTKGMRLETLLKKLHGVRVPSPHPGDAATPGTWQYCIFSPDRRERLSRDLSNSHEWMWERQDQLFEEGPVIVIETSGRLLPDAASRSATPDPDRQPRPDRGIAKFAKRPPAGTSGGAGIQDESQDRTDARELAALDYLSHSKDTWLLLPDTATERSLVETLNGREPLWSATAPISPDRGAPPASVSITGLFFDDLWHSRPSAVAALDVISANPDLELDLFDLLAAPDLLGVPQEGPLEAEVAPLRNRSLLLREALLTRADFGAERQGSGVFLVLTEPGQHEEAVSVGALVDYDKEAVRLRLVFNSDMRDRALLVPHRNELRSELHAALAGYDGTTYRPTPDRPASNSDAQWAAGLANRMREILAPLTPALDTFRVTGDAGALATLVNKPAIDRPGGDSCKQSGCERTAMQTTGLCLAHWRPRDPFDWGDALQRELKGSRFLDGTFMTIDEELSYALQWVAHDTASPSLVDFTGSRFLGDFTISGPCESLTVNLDQARIEGTLHLYHPQMDDLILTDAEVRGDVEGTARGPGGLFASRLRVGGSMGGETLAFTGIYLDSSRIRGDLDLRDVGANSLISLAQANIGGTLTLPKTLWGRKQLTFSEGARIGRVEGE